MGLPSFQFILKDVLIDEPEDWMDVKILGSFDNKAMQANITTEQFTFVGNGASLLISIVEAGKTGGTGIFEGVSLNIYANDNGQALTAFEGFMDFNTYEQLSPVRVKCGIMKLNGLNSFSDRAEATTYSYLFNKNVFLPSDFIQLPYVVEKQINGIEILTMSVTIFMMTKELIDQVKTIVEDITHVVKAATPDIAIPPVPNIGQIVSAIILIIIDIVIAILISIALTELLIELIEKLISPVRFHAVSTQRDLLSKATAFLGKKFVSPIPELDETIFLPSSPADNGPIQIGLPKAADFGYRVSEQFEIAHKQYRAKTAIIGDEVHLRTLDDPFWKKTSTYVLRDTLEEGRMYNTEDLKANILIQYATDQSDEHTIDDFKGTVFEVITEPISVDNEDMVLIKGLEEISIPLALGSRKDKLNDIEQILKPLIGFGDSIVNAFGGSSSQAKSIDQRVGMLKLSQRQYNTAKLIPFNGETIPKNPRDIVGAKASWDKYINEMSFISNGFAKQMRQFRGVKIPFTLADFIKLEKNSFFVTQDGDDGEAIKFEWSFADDFAIADFDIKEIYTKNLKETEIEPA